MKDKKNVPIGLSLSNQFKKAYLRVCRIGLNVAIVLCAALVMFVGHARGAGDEPEVYVIKYAEFDKFPNYLAYWMGEPQYTNQPPLNYYMMYWLIKTKERNILVDVGSGEAFATRYQKYQTPDILLAKIGLKVSDIDTVILTHPHFDHFDGIEFFKDAKVYVQRAAYRYVVEECPELTFFRNFLYPRKKDFYDMVDLMWEGRLKLLDGDKQLFPGISVIRVDGHYPGLQIVVVSTEGKPIVIASDAVHVYDNLEKDKPMGLFQGEVLDVVKGFETIRELNGVVLPGHDNKVGERFKDRMIDEAIFKIYP